MYEYPIGSGAPTYYDHINICNASVNPSQIHVNNTGLNRFFERYLLQKAMSVFEWKMPKNWSKDYFLYVLYCWGFISVINTDKFGVIPQGCSLKGYDVFYRPTKVVIANPLLNGIKDLTINEECTLFKLQPDYGGILDIIQFYANMLALSAETAGTNLVNSKLAYCFRAADKATAESFKKMFDEISSGKPAVFIDKHLMNDDGSPSWDTFAQDLKGNYIAGDILNDMRKWEMKFDTEIGIPNANTEKKERLISDEVNANNFETKSKCELWLEELKDAAARTREMFDIDISVDWRKSLNEPISEPSGGENDVSE